MSDKIKEALKKYETQKKEFDDNNLREKWTKEELIREIQKSKVFQDIRKEILGRIENIKVFKRTTNDEKLKSDYDKLIAELKIWNSDDFGSKIQLTGATGYTNSNLLVNLNKNTNFYEVKSTLIFEMTNVINFYRHYETDRLKLNQKEDEEKDVWKEVESNYPLKNHELIRMYRNSKVKAKKAAKITADSEIDSIINDQKFDAETIAQLDELQFLS